MSCTYIFHQHTYEKYNYQYGDNVRLASVKIENLGQDTKVRDVQDLFTPYGLIHHTFLGQNLMTNAHYGYAFVTMVGKEAALKACFGLNNLRFEGNQIRVYPVEQALFEEFMEMFNNQVPNPNPVPHHYPPLFTIKVGNVAYWVQDYNLYYLFELCGSIANFYLPKDPAKPELNRGFAFISYYRANDAVNAIHRFNYQESFGRCLRVKIIDTNLINVCPYSKDFCLAG